MPDSLAGNREMAQNASIMENGGGLRERFAAALAKPFRAPAAL